MSAKGIRVLIGNCEPALTASMAIYIRRMIGDRAIVSFTETGYLNELTTFCKDKSYDLYILVLNNLLWKPGEGGGFVAD